MLLPNGQRLWHYDSGDAPAPAALLGPTWEILPSDFDATGSRVMMLGQVTMADGDGETLEVALALDVSIDGTFFARYSVSEGDGFPSLDANGVHAWGITEGLVFPRLIRPVIVVAGDPRPKLQVIWDLACSEPFKARRLG